MRQRPLLPLRIQGGRWIPPGSGSRWRLPGHHVSIDFIHRQIGR